MNNQSYNLCILILFLTYTFSFSCYSQEIILKGSIKDSNKKAIGKYRYREQRYRLHFQ